jgi:carbonic anhydrase
MKQIPLFGILAVLPLVAAVSAWAGDAKQPAKGHGGEAAAEPAPRAEPVDPMDRLRERLAVKLGATKPAEAGGAQVLRVTTHATAEPAAPAAALAPVARKAAPKAAEKGPAHDAHWDYKGEVGPQAWGGLKPEFSTCSTGKRQSPIDIRDGIAVDLEPVQFDYRASGFSIIDNGHTVQVNLAPGNFIQAQGRRWELVQFHFHRPSEERIDGRQFDMVAHLVHKDSDGKLAVVAVLLDRGSIQPLVQTIWNNLPLEKGEEMPARAVIDLNHLLPPDRRYYTYMGSLTTPPCSEGVLWMVMRQPVPLSQEQIDIFARLYPMNARPVQQASGRLIKQSN